MATASPFADALAQLSSAGAKGGLVARVDHEGNAKAAIAVRLGKGWSVGAEYDYDRLHGKSAGWVGVEWMFGAEK